MTAYLQYAAVIHQMTQQSIADKQHFPILNTSLSNFRLSRENLTRSFT